MHPKRRTPTCGASMTDEEPRLLRQRLVEVLDELAGLQQDELEIKHRLHTEADDLRRRLAERAGDDAEIATRWAARAARKNSQQEDTRAAEALIRAPGAGLPD